MSEPQKQQEQPKNNRIPVRKIYLREPEDFPSNSNTTIIDCAQQPEGRQYWVANYVPSQLLIELELHRPGRESYRTRLPVCVNVRRFD